MEMAETLYSILPTYVGNYLIDSIIQQQKTDPSARGAVVTFDAERLLRHLGATDVRFETRCAKGYTFVRVTATGADGIDCVWDFSQRRQMTQEVYDTLESSTQPVTALRVAAGYWVLPDGAEKNSFRWDAITLGETPIALGPVRKWDGVAYSAPIIDEDVDDEDAEAKDKE